MPRVGETPWEAHKRLWKNCTRCRLAEERKNVCLVRGTLPCTVLFIGEAPGFNEDGAGSPFVGPAGKRLDAHIAEAWRLTGSSATYALTNLIGCIPKAPADEDDPDGTKIKVEEPPEDAIQACSPRIDSLVRIAKPLAIVTVGKVANREVGGQGRFLLPGQDWLPWLGTDGWIEFVSIMHPAFILRQNIGQQGLSDQKNIVALAHLLHALGDRGRVG
jgi:uracil-DNA glycosylase family 4